MFSSEPGNGTLPPAPLFLGVDLLHFRTPLLFYFPTSVCWDDQLHSKELTNLPLFLGILCIRLWGRCSRRQSWFAFQMVWFVQVIFCLYYWDGLFSLFFLDDLKLYELSSYCLIKFCRSKKKKKSVAVCRNVPQPPVLLWPPVDAWDITTSDLSERPGACCLPGERVWVCVCFFLFVYRGPTQDAAVTAPIKSEVLMTPSPSVLLGGMVTKTRLEQFLWGANVSANCHY